MIIPTLKTIFNAQNVNGASSPMFVKDERHLLIQVDMVGFTGTLKFAGSLQEEIPDFSASQSASNSFDRIAVKDYQDASTIAGDTGISGTATTDSRIFEVNSNGLNWFGVVASSVSAGSVNVKVIPYNNC